MRLYSEEIESKLEKFEDDFNRQLDFLIVKAQRHGNKTATEMVMLKEPILKDYLYLKKIILSLLNNNRLQRIHINDAINNDFIRKKKVAEAFDEIYDYIDRLNGPDEDAQYIESVRKKLLGE